MNSTTNSTTRIINVDSTISNTTVALSFIIAGIIVAVNIVEIIILCRLTHRRVYEKLLLSLTISDLCSGIAEIVIISTYYMQLQNGTVFRAKHAVFAFFLFTSILHQIWLSLDRLWAVKSPIKHNIATNGRKVAVVVVVTWLINISAVVAYCIFQEMNVQKIDNDRERWTLTKSYHDTFIRVIGSLILIADFVLIISYSMVIYRVRKRAVPNRSNSSTSRYNQQKRVTTMCLLITGSFVTTTLPYICFNILDKSLVTSINHVIANHWIRILVISNALLNSLIYLVQNYWKTFPCGRKTGNSSEEKS